MGINPFKRRPQDTPNNQAPADHAVPQQLQNSFNMANNSPAAANDTPVVGSPQTSGFVPAQPVTASDSTSPVSQTNVSPFDVVNNPVEAPANKLPDPAAINPEVMAPEPAILPDLPTSGGAPELNHSPAAAPAADILAPPYNSVGNTVSDALPSATPSAQFAPTPAPAMPPSQVINDPPDLSSNPTNTLATPTPVMPSEPTSPSVNLPNPSAMPESLPATPGIPSNPAQL